MTEFQTSACMQELTLSIPNVSHMASAVNDRDIFRDILRSDSLTYPATASSTARELDRLFGKSRQYSFNAMIDGLPELSVDNKSFTYRESAWMDVEVAQCGSTRAFSPMTSQQWEGYNLIIAQVTGNQTPSRMSQSATTLAVYAQCGALRRGTQLQLEFNLISRRNHMQLFDY